MYRYNAAGIVPPNQYCRLPHDDGCEDDDDDILLKQLLFWIFCLKIDYYLLRQRIDRHEWVWYARGARLFLLPARARRYNRIRM